MSYGDYPRYFVTLKTVNKNELRVPGLRDEAPNSECKVYMMINGQKKLVRIEK